MGNHNYMESKTQTVVILRNNPTYALRLRRKMILSSLNTPEAQSTVGNRHQAAYFCNIPAICQLERIKLLHACEFTILTLSWHLSDKVFKVNCSTLQTWRTCPEKGPLNPVTSLPSWDRCNAVLRERTQNPEILQYTKGTSVHFLLAYRPSLS